MDKVFSTRMDNEVIEALTQAVRKTGMSKKRFVEQAIKNQVREMGVEYGTNIWEETSGAWKRDESPAETVRKIRNRMLKSMRRHRDV